MGTRGIYGFRKNNEDKITYNHFDSYPSCLGEEIIDYLKINSIEKLNTLYDKLILVDEEFKISDFSEEQKEKYKRYLEEIKNSKTSEIDMDMYSFLRQFQGDLKKYDEFPEIDLMLDNRGFIKISLFCEWGYIINLDDNTLEIWKGFQKKPQKNNRYGNGKWEGYYPCKNIKKIKLKKIKKEDFSLENEIKEYYY